MRERIPGFTIHNMGQCTMQVEPVHIWICRFRESLTVRLIKTVIKAAENIIHVKNATAILQIIEWYILQIMEIDIIQALLVAD